MGASTVIAKRGGDDTPEMLTVVIAFAGDDMILSVQDKNGTAVAELTEAEAFKLTRRIIDNYEALHGID